MTGGDWAWDRFWHFDRVASCCDQAGRANYDERIALGWRSFFEALEPGAKLLDLCTGNGAVALIALEVSDSEGKEFAITGVDRAAIDPARFAVTRRDGLQRIAFHSQVEAEQLPFPDACFDAVTSQYGIEYSDLERSLAEATRVLAPAGRLRFCMHAAEGTVAESTRAALADADFMLDEVELPRRATDAFTAVLSVERNPTPTVDARGAADQALAAFRGTLGAIAERIRRGADPEMMDNARSVLLHAFQNRAHFPLEVLVAKAAEIRTEIEAHRIRQRALLDAAVDAEKLHWIELQLQSLGLDNVRASKVCAGATFLGYVVEAQVPR
jgi:ubiquinone/menaquinone biosynthesis C-methylase UbiE